MIKILSKCIGEYKKISIITSILAILQVAGQITIPILISNLIDYGINKGNMSHIIKIGIVLLAVSLFSLFCGRMAGQNAAISSAGFAKNLREKMYRKVQDFSFSNIDKFSTASIITRLTTDVTNIQNAYQMLILRTVRAPIMLISSLIVSFYLHAQLSCIFLVCILLLSIGLYFVTTTAHPIFTKVFKTYDKLNSVVEENLSGIRVVKSFNREDYENKKFANISNIIYKKFLKAEKIISLNIPLMQFCMYSCTILIAWFGAKLIVSCRNDAVISLSTGELLSLITYTSQILTSLMILSMVLVMLTMAVSSAKRIVEILNEKSDLSNTDNPINTIKNGNISFKNVSFSYVNNKHKLCLHDINLNINSGEIIGIIGGTGSGKSTLVHLIPRLYDATIGTVKIDNIDVKKYDIESLRNSVAMVLQKNTLFSGTITENLRWGNNNATLEDIKRVCDLAQASEFIENLPKKYDTYIEQGGTNVSGGQKQRLCIARALLKNPKILILDDSTSALDTKTDSLIRKSFKKFLPNTTKIIISQRILSVQNADKIIVMDTGKIVDFDTHDNLLKNCQLYRDTYKLQQKGGK